MKNISTSKEIIRDIAKAKYWLRINGYRPEQFGTGMKWNPIKLTRKKL